MHWYPYRGRGGKGSGWEGIKGFLKEVQRERTGEGRRDGREKEGSGQRQGGILLQGFKGIDAPG